MKKIVKLLKSVLVFVMFCAITTDLILTYRSKNLKPDKPLNLSTLFYNMNLYYPQVGPILISETNIFRLADFKTLKEKNKNLSFYFIENTSLVSDYELYSIKRNGSSNVEKIRQCHACSPELGIVVYDNENGKILVKDFNLGKFGEYGTLWPSDSYLGSIDTKKNIKIFSNENNKILLAIDFYSTGQGIIETYTHFFLIEITQINTLIHNLGFLHLGEDTLGYYGENDARAESYSSDFYVKWSSDIKKWPELHVTTTNHLNSISSKRNFNVIGEKFAENFN